MLALALLLMTASVTGCNGNTLATDDGFCLIYVPIYPTKADWKRMSQPTANMINQNNIAHRELCS